VVARARSRLAHAEAAARVKEREVERLSRALGSAEVHGSSAATEVRGCTVALEGGSLPTNYPHHTHVVDCQPMPRCVPPFIPMFAPGFAG
jgi:hypothetical protein